MPQYRVHLALTSTKATLARAERLIRLVEEDSRLGDPLLGSVILLLSTSLEQAIGYWLKLIAHEDSQLDEIPESNRALELLDKPLWRRVKEAPSLSLQEPFEPHHKNDYVNFLSHLIRRRNQLVHIEQEPVDFDVNIPATEGGQIDLLRKVTLEAIEDGALDRLQINQPWREVTIAEARRSLAAVNIYIEALLEADAESIHLLTEPS